MEEHEPITSPEALEYGFCNELGVNDSVRFLKNISGLWLIQECKRHWELDGEKYNYFELSTLAGEAEPFTAFIDPDHAAFASPGGMPDKIRAFCERTGQAVTRAPGEILRVATE